MSALTASVQFYNRRVVKTKLGKEFCSGKMARIRSHPATPRGQSEPVITGAPQVIPRPGMTRAASSLKPSQSLHSIASAQSESAENAEERPILRSGLIPVERKYREVDLERSKRAKAKMMMMRQSRKEVTIQMSSSRPFSLRATQAPLLPQMSWGSLTLSGLSGWNPSILTI